MPVIIRVFRKKHDSERNTFPEETCFRKSPISRRNVFPFASCHQKVCVFGRNMSPEETCFWREHASGRDSFLERTRIQKKLVFGRLIFDRTPLGGSYSYKCPKVIRKVYLTSVFSGKTWDAEASQKICLMGELSMRFHCKAKCSRSHRPWPGRFPFSP